ncbi:carboxyl transferase domain-containing protein [Alteromonas sp. a30]|uniref:carboxyl transferase domain-containing protein n=1 Tax=Alteromonas sp. a30 TaxID=2730917 RepID=UPI002280E4F8|nr:carboxyl transferase domain-containing protein [Alteromonas sp. a30]MCY7297227.1 hypothetical protein [Alteromonas sp. a30]
MTVQQRPEYHWLSVDTNETRFLSPLSSVVNENMQLFCLSSEDKPNRMNADGIWMVRGRANGREVAVCWSDFRVKGASFSANNCMRLQAFLKAISEQHIPLIFCINSLGFRFVEGRKMFDRVFAVIPALIKFKRQNLLITMCQGKCLGLGAMLFSLGHYRIAASPHASVNLTGPEVFQQFFGAKVDFQAIAGAEAVKKRTGLIHEVATDVKQAFLLAGRLMTTLAYKGSLPKLALPNLDDPALQGILEDKSLIKAEIATVECLLHLTRQGIELFKGFDTRLKAFVIDIRGQQVAMLMNPPDQINNMFSYRSLDLYQQAIALFAALKLPLVLMIDTPGIDPRFDGDNKDIIQKVVSVTDDLIHYPMPTVGVINGRGFGGANTLALPKCYGAVARYAIKGRAHIDVMHESIMKELLSGSKNSLENWQEIQAQQDPHCSDMIDGEILDDIIPIEALEERLWQDLFSDTCHQEMQTLAEDVIQAPAAP